ncbi:MAG: cytochrome c class [Pseudonocardia sp.]|jgi:ubiquinol-cytochrome c reductase cytochrome c subunit|uniref:cytochrome bc1 complex diheme cytochrome c subunit n=1 Tax=Pseudonocardia sp. TaxID=60912 RepID=UPI00261EB7E5|nr:cytochrome c [Pseudonocardia sp.]MCU1627452.1 cytochrome c class [Pseudonocardia sp.]MDT7698266.1 ubiquinol-cytochrome c reductase cytochrome c subunit [Pseudonocardiales bacterium]HEV7470089.1 cytochrome c [Pseudonocardia sp.]
MTSQTTESSPPPAPRNRRPHGKFRRRFAGALAIGIGLLAVGVGYDVVKPEPQQAVAQDNAALVAQGQQLYYNNACITCHGANLQGVENRGPSLVGVGDAATYFQVSSGRMPLARQEAQAMRKAPLPQFDPNTEEGRHNLDALGAFVDANGGGPQVPAQTGVALRGDDPARGGQLFRLNCSSCHNFVGVGGALSSGKYAPSLDPASEEQIYTAMLTGPQNMPKFADRQLTPGEKKDIIAYVKSVTNGNNNPGGNPLGGLGPTSEGVIIFVVGLTAVIGFAMWLGAKN